MDAKPDSDDRWTYEELLTPQSVRLMWWYLIKKITKYQRFQARRHGDTNDDIIQGSCLRIPKNRLPLRKWKRTTICCVAVKWQIYRMMNFTRLDHLSFSPLEDLDREMDIPSSLPSWQLTTQEKQDTVDALLKTIPSRQSHILKLRFGLKSDEKTLQEVAFIYRLSRERIRQIERHALGNLKARDNLYLDKCGEPKV